MQVGICNLKLIVLDSVSLKDKRSVVQSLTRKLRNNFNVSVAEENLDSWKEAHLTVVSVNTEKEHLLVHFQKL